MIPVQCARWSCKSLYILYNADICTKPYIMGWQRRLYNVRDYKGSGINVRKEEKFKKNLFKFNLCPCALNSIRNQSRRAYIYSFTTSFFFFSLYICIYYYIIRMLLYHLTAFSIPKRPRSVTIQLYKFVVCRVPIHKNANARHLKVKYFIVTITTSTWLFFWTRDTPSFSYNILHTGTAAVLRGRRLFRCIYTFFRCVDWLRVLDASPAGFSVEWILR